MSSSDSAIQELKRLLTRDRQAFLVYVDLDPVPGTFHTTFSASENIKGILDFHIPQYDPTVVLVGANLYEREKYARQRVCFAVYVDLDPVPGTFHSKESARNGIGRLLDERIHHYNPIVSIAPADIQPSNIVEGNR